MSRKGNCLDNAIIENFFRNSKIRNLHIKIASVEELKQEIRRYINYYNNERIKSNFNKMSSIFYLAHYYQD